MNIVETERLILREFQQDDYRELSLILANLNVMKFSVSGCLTVAQTPEKINSYIDSYRQYGFGKWAVILKQEKRLIGYCGIAVEEIDGKKETELGYRLSDKYWGKGLATEAAKTALQLGKTKVLLLIDLDVPSCDAF
jgi:[ribosomal protein S5]-alanine N-acetyltransferase